jgi:ABC-type nickel/cobalt efflux system permease component RcnA
MTFVGKISMVVLWVILSIQSIYAHPLDVSSTTFLLQDKTIQWTTYLHNYEVTILLAKKWHAITEVGEVYPYADEILDYFKNHVNILNNGNTCEIRDLRLIKKEAFQVLASGFQLEYTILCTEKIGSLITHVNLFTDFELQTNRLSIIESDGTEAYYKVWTHKITELQYKRGEKIEQKDTDQDGVSDEEELVYKTDPKNRDTDGDHYLDGEEINYGWDPLNKMLSYGQSQRMEYPKIFLITPKTGITQINTNTSHARDLSQNGIGSDIFQKVLKIIGNTISKEDETSFFIIFFLVMGLGFLHAIGPGHAKSLLAAMMIHKKASFWTGLKFIGIFSVTHIIDIFFLYLCLVLFMRFFDSTMLINIIPKISAITLLCLGIYLIFRAWKGYEEKEETYSNSQTWIMWIVAGIAPCTFGWSLFFLLLSLGKISWIPPLIFAIALWIFLCLFWILIIIHSSKDILYSKSSSLSKYSLHFSAFFIFCLWIYFCINTFIF